MGQRSENLVASGVIRKPRALLAFSLVALAIACHPSTAAAGSRPGEVTVVRRLTAFKTEDAAVLAKVRQAFAAAEPAMLAHTTQPVPQSGRGLFSPLARYEYHPDAGKAPWAQVKTSGGLAGYGGYLDTGVEANVVMARYDGWPPPLAANTSGIIWDREQTACIFVTVDGGRYFVPCAFLETGLAPAASWPPPLQHSLLLPNNVIVLAAMGELPAQAATQIKQGMETFARCAKGITKTRDGELDANRRANITAETRANRESAISVKYARLLHGKCGGTGASLEPTLAKWIRVRDAARTKLYEALKTSASP